MNNNPQNSDQESEEGIDLRQLFYKLLAKWYWIVLSIIVCMGLAYFYSRYTTPQYRITAKVLINDEKKGGGPLGGSEMFADLSGLLGTKNSVDNEAEILRTRFLMEQVVRDLNLNVRSFKTSTFKDVELYEAPFKIQMIQPADTVRGERFELRLLDDGHLALSTKDFEKKIRFNEPVSYAGVGTFAIITNPKSAFGDGSYSFSIASVDAAVAALMDRLAIEVVNKQVSVINLSLTYPIPQRGEDILNKLIRKYVQGNLEDKNEVADSTIKFIQNRLSYIGGELGSLESSIQTFKQQNKLANIEEQSKLLVENTSGYLEQMAQVETQLSVLEGLRGYLENASDKRVLPSSLLPQDMVFSGLIERYNSLLLQRDKSLLGVTVDNPVVKNIDKQIANLRLDMLANLYSTENALNITKSNLQNQISLAEGQVREVPEIERDYLNLARQQQIKQELFIFLMQKAEETAISKTANIAGSRTIDPPKSAFRPFSPKKSMIYSVSFALGLIIPIGLIYLLDMMDTRVNTKEDIMQVTEIPVLGEISHNDDQDNMVVANRSRSAIAEQFRAMRTNLSFYLNGKDEKVILLTSSMSGEGKSFVAINFGNILALSGKKVLLMELDLRKPGLSVKLNLPNVKGFTNYIIQDELKANDLVQQLPFQENLYLLSSGPIPPNPAETILHARTMELMNELKTQFDYIIVDAPPIGVVADAQLLESYADLALYIVRQGFTLKAQVKIANDLYRQEKMKKMGIVVNDIDASSGYGYGHGYGYGYGYGNYETPSESGRLAKLFKRRK